ncbi:MAG: hypothetical protein AAB390_01805 [Patescibacteria group bacterium]
MSTHCSQTLEFQKDYKKLAKRYRTLADDLAVFENVVAIKPLGFGKNFVVLARQKGLVIVKARLFCRSLKRNSLRIIYAYTEQSLEIEPVGIEFIELYFKGDKEREDSERIKLYLESR